VNEQRRGRIDRGWRRRLLSVLVDQPNTVERAKRPLLTARVCANDFVGDCLGLAALADFLARVATEESRARHRRSGDDGQKRKKCGATVEHDDSLTQQRRVGHVPT
jgi:hypothetical protein